MKTVFNSILVTFFAAGYAQAGNISSSGGGELIGDAGNPWFLESVAGEPNSPPVKYCVKAGPDFVVEIDQLKKMVKATISWWDLQASSAHFPENDIFTVGGGRQRVRIRFQTSRYVELADCDGSEDLAFFFGYLSEKQRADLKEENIDTTKFVGLTIRTEYSSRMRAKGYIYISPDRGELAMRSPNVISDIWKTSSMYELAPLSIVLRHEFGHVLGIGHTLSGIMGSRTPEAVTSTLLNSSIYSDLKKPVFFPGSTSFRSCDRKVHFDLFKVFQIPIDQSCVEFYADLGRVHVVSRSSSEPQSPTSIIADQVLTTGYQQRFRELVSVILPTVRDVLIKVPEFIRSLRSAQMTEIQQTIDLNVHSKAISLRLQKDSDRFQLDASFDGKFYRDIYPEGSGWTE